jgi:hypothetical protein
MRLRTADDAEGAREARATVCGSKVDNRGRVRRDGTTLNWSTPSVSDGSTPEPAVTRVPRRRSLCSVCARPRIARWGSESELRMSRHDGCRPTMLLSASVFVRLPTRTPHTQHVGILPCARSRCSHMAPASSGPPRCSNEPDALAAHEWTSNARVEREHGVPRELGCPSEVRPPGANETPRRGKGQRKVRRAAASREWHSAAMR